MTKLFTSLLAVLAFAGSGRADDLASSINFYYQSSSNGTPVPVTPPLNAIAFPDTVSGKTSTVTLLIQTSQNSTHTYAIKTPLIRGAAFSVSQQSATVPPMASGFGTIAIVFAPTAGDFATGTLQFTLVSENNLSFDYAFTLSGRVISSKVSTSYIVSPTNNQTTISSGNTISFPNTPVNSTSQATFVVSNTGTAPATVDSVSLTGDGYKLSSLSLVPASVPAGGDFRFVINFAPLAAKRYSGSLMVSINGTSGTYLLDGQGTIAALTYQTLTGTTAKPLLPGQTVTFPDTTADGVAKSTVTVQVTNTGNADGTLSNISISGADFTLANVPALPRVLPATNFSTFDVVFQPSKPGPTTGRLQIGNDVFLLAGNGLGSLLTVTVDYGTGPIPILNRGTIAVPNTAVGTRRSVFVTVTNTGNLPATVSSFSASGTVFTTPPSPLPVALAAGQSQSFEVRFTPLATGAVTGTLTINDLLFTLVGSGDPPAALPAVTISGVSAQTDPLQQPTATVQIAKPYTSDLRGALTLTFLSDSFTDDPAIQFANGTRTVNFTIPANTTQAVFDQLGRSAPFQTGTVSGRVLLTANFTIGTVDITPTTAPSVSTTIPQGPPQLSSVRLGTVSSSSIQLLISGYSTSRSVQQLALQFTGVSGTNLQTTSQNVDVSSAFTNWYADPASRPFGSQFTLTLTLTVTGDINALQSVSLTASNAKGTSIVKSVALK